MRRGPDELLLTTPFRRADRGRKFLVTYGFVVLMMAASFVYPAMATVEGGIGAEHLLAVFVGLSLHALGLASLGLACSAWSSSQLVAAVASWAAGFVLWDFAWAGPFVNESSGRLLDLISMHPRYGSFSEGIVNLEHFAYLRHRRGVRALALLRRCAARERA